MKNRMKVNFFNGNVDLQDLPVGVQVFTLILVAGVFLFLASMIKELMLLLVIRKVISVGAAKLMIKKLL